jgi:hypothetical protein
MPQLVFLYHYPLTEGLDMRILTTFKDYYDGVQGMYQDDLLLKRRPEDIEVRLDEPSVIRDLLDVPAEGHKRAWDYLSLEYLSTEGTNPKKEFDIMLFLIGFCGHLYVGVKASETYRSSYGSLQEFLSQVHAPKDKPKHDYLYSAEDLLQWGKGNGVPETPKRQKRSRPTRWRGTKISLAKVKSRLLFLQNEVCGDREHPDLFEKLGVPLFTVRPTRILGTLELTINGCLGDLGFYQIFDSFSAYQELRMWVSNQASPEKDMPNFGDDLKAASKGFDKFSFRKDPSKKKGG